MKKPVYKKAWGVLDYYGDISRLWSGLYAITSSRDSAKRHLYRGAGERVVRIEYRVLEGKK